MTRPRASAAPVYRLLAAFLAALLLVGTAFTLVSAARNGRWAFFWWWVLAAAPGFVLFALIAWRGETGR